MDKIPDYLVIFFCLKECENCLDLFSITIMRQQAEVEVCLLLMGISPQWVIVGGCAQHLGNKLAIFHLNSEPL